SVPPHQLLAWRRHHHGRRGRSGSRTGGMAAESEPATFQARPPTALAVQAPLATKNLAILDAVADGVCRLTLNRPDALNALNRERFGLPEVTLGFNPAYGIARLLDVAGGSHGRDLLLTGRTIHASEALRMGLVNRVVAPPTLEASALKWAVEIAASPREGLASTKQIVAAIRAGGPGTEPRSYGAALKTSAAARARIKAFADRRRGS